MTDHQQQNGILSHPAFAFLSILAIVVALPADLAWWFGQGPGWVAALFSGIGAGVTIWWLSGNNTQSALITSIQLSPQPASLTQLPIPRLQLSQGEIYLEAESPGTLGRHFYKDAFEAMITGNFVGEPYTQFFQAVGGLAQEWVFSRYQDLVTRYPGMRGEKLKQNLYATLYREIKNNCGLDAESAWIVIPAVDKYISTRFATEI